MRKLELALCVGILLLAGPAQAIGIYGEIITSGSAWFLPNIRATIDLDFDTWGVPLNHWSVSPDYQMGSGHVSSGEWITWEHTFEPGKSGATLKDAYVLVTTGDHDWEEETAELYMGGDLWKTESFRFFSFAGGSAIGAVKDNVLRMGVKSVYGDFNLKSSIFKAKYEAAAPMPEPHAVLAFGLGLAVVAARLRRRARSS